ncbi:hypothetical protein MCOR10_004184, partial [Pyricularia oryzae]
MGIVPFTDKDSSESSGGDVQSISTEGSELEIPDSRKCENENGTFTVRGKYLFVTYNHSRIENYEEFYRCLKKSVVGIKLADGKYADIRFYGSQERHQDGTPHYHVVIDTGKRVHWPNARKRLQVYVELDGKMQVDIESIRINTLAQYANATRFLDYCQAYVSKVGNDCIFGEWIEVTSSAQVRVDRETAKYQELVGLEYADDARSFAIKHFPK